MRPYLAAAIAVLCAQQLSAKSILIRNVSLVDVETGEIQADRDVSIVDGRIKSVTASGSKGRADLTINGRAKYLMPGLWDTHLHLDTLEPGAFQLLVAQGITSVRDMGGKVEDLKRWRGQIEGGTLIGPRIKFCGPMLEAPGDVSLKNPNHEAVDGPAAAKAVVARLRAEGVDCIKTRSINDEPTYRALAEAAKATGLPLMGHPPFALDPPKITHLGQATFEHAFYPYPYSSLDAAKKEQIKSAFRASSVKLAPSFIAWKPSTKNPADLRRTFDGLDRARLADAFINRRMRYNWLEGLIDFEKQKRGSPGWIKAVDSAASDISEFSRSEIPILLGTDMGAPFVYPDGAVHQELKLLVTDAKLSPAQALRAATLEPAKLFNMERQMGTLEPGMIGDVILLSTNPLADIGNVADIHTVITRGKAYGPEHRRRMRLRARQATFAAWKDKPLDR